MPNRREFVRLLCSGGALALARAAGLLRPRSAAAQTPQWTIRGVTASDATLLPPIFNAQLAASLFAFSDKITPWTTDKAARFLAVYNGTVLLLRDDVPVGFGGLIDYDAPDCTSSIAPDAEPEAKMLAIRVDLLGDADRLVAVKHLAAAIAGAFQRMGFAHCTALIPATTGFQALFATRMTVKQTLDRNGVSEAKEVRYALA